MFINSQQISIDILLICEVITPHKIIKYNLFAFILYFFLFLFLRIIASKQSPNSRTRLHRGNIKQNSKLDHTKNFIQLDQDITKRIELRKMIKVTDVMVIRYRGTS